MSPDLEPAALLDDFAATAPPADPARLLAGVRRRVRRRRVAQAVVAVACVAGVVVGGVETYGGGPSTGGGLGRISPATRPQGSAARVALARYLAAHGPVAGSSVPVVAPAGTFAAYTSRQRLLVLSWDGAAWSQVSALDLELAALPAPVQVASPLSGPGGPLFVTALLGADDVPGSAVGYVDGGWRLLAFQGCGGAACARLLETAEPSLTVQGDGEVTSSYNACTPSCAAGASTTVVWTWRKSRQRYLPASS